MKPPMLNAGAAPEIYEIIPVRTSAEAARHIADRL